MIEHIVPALLIQLAITLLLRSLPAGAAVACVWAVSREITQAEYRWIEQFGGGRRANMPWWGGLDPQVWNFKSLGDVLFPAIAVVAVYGIARVVRFWQR